MLFGHIFWGQTEKYAPFFCQKSSKKVNARETRIQHLKRNPNFRSSYPMYNNSVLAPVIQSNPGYHSVHPNLHPSNPLHPANGLHPNLHPSNGLPALHPNLHHPSNGLPVIHPGIPLGHGHKKPIPLPRSKIPVPTPKSATVDRLGKMQLFFVGIISILNYQIKLINFVYFVVLG